MSTAAAKRRTTPRRPKQQRSLLGTLIGRVVWPRRKELRVNMEKLHEGLDTYLTSHPVSEMRDNPHAFVEHLFKAGLVK